jgi:hypothetical protein
MLHSTFGSTPRGASSHHLDIAVPVNASDEEWQQVMFKCNWFQRG